MPQTATSAYVHMLTQQPNWTSHTPQHTKAPTQTEQTRQSTINSGYRGRGAGSHGRERGRGRPRNTDSSYDNSCKVCGQPGHWRIQCPWKDTHCPHCGRKGHIADRCRYKQSESRCPWPAPSQYSYGTAPNSATHNPPAWNAAAQQVQTAVTFSNRYPYPIGTWPTPQALPWPPQQALPPPPPPPAGAAINTAQTNPAINQAAQGHVPYVPQAGN